MRVLDWKALARELGLRCYSNLRKAELIRLLRSHDASTQTSTGITTNVSTMRTRPSKSTGPPLLSPSRASPQMSTWEPVHDRLTPSLQEMDIFEQQEMAKCRPQVTSKLKEWQDGLTSHLPKPIRDKASRAFKTFKDKVLGCTIKLRVRKT